MLSVDEDVDAAVTGFAVIRLSLGHWPSFSLSVIDVSLCCEEMFMMHVFRVVCYMEVRCGHCK